MRCANCGKQIPKGETLTTEAEANAIRGAHKNYVAELREKRLKELTDKLYNLNANISLYFVAMKKEPTNQDMRSINHDIGEIIKGLSGKDGIRLWTLS